MGTGAKKSSGAEVSAILHGHILAMDDNWTEYEDGMILIDSGVITSVGPFNKDAAASLDAGKVFDARGNIVIPGLVNTHTHIGMALFRGLADDTADRLRKIIFPLEKQYVSGRLVYLASLLSLAEMILGGTTCFADMYFFQDMAARAADESGVRALLGQAVSHDPAPDAPGAAYALELTGKLAESLRGNPRVFPAIAPHAPYSLTRDELLQCSDISRSLNIPLFSHLAEMPFEEAWVKEYHDMRPVPYYHSCGILGPLSTMAHCIFTDEDDRKLLIETGTGIAYNPSANSKSGKGIAPACDLLNSGARLGLGTDGPMSSNTMDLVHQFSIASKMQKVLKHDPTVMNPRQVLRCATLGGAEALHLEKNIGSLEAGKRADIAVFSTDAPSMYPLYDPYSALVYAAAPSDVRAVIVDGSLLMKDRTLLSLDVASIKEASAEMVDRIGRELGGKV